MEQTPKQQITDLILSSKNILVVSHKNPDGDSLGCLIALKLVLEKLDKKITMACADKPAKAFLFLPKVNEIKTEIDASKNLVIALNTESASIKSLGYKKNHEQNTVEIFITPSEGSEFHEADVRVLPARSSFDLAIVLDTPNIERLGNLATDDKLFNEIPIVNIDHHPANERFGKVNYIELAATSTAEVLVSLIEALSRDKQLMDENVATALLTGLIYDTSSFQNINTTPKSLTVAAQLVAAGARQQEIVKNLYKTKTLETLKLWGIILQNVKEDKIHHFLWSTVTKEEIERVGSDESAIGGILDELLKSATDVDFALLLSERENQVHGSMRSIAKDINVASVAKIFGGGGHEVAAAFRVDGTLKEKEDMILSKIRSAQNQQEVAPLPQADDQGNNSTDQNIEEIQVEETATQQEEVVESKLDLESSHDNSKEVREPAGFDPNGFADPFSVVGDHAVAPQRETPPVEEKKKMEIESEPFVIADQARFQEPVEAPIVNEEKESPSDENIDLETKW